MSKVATYLSLGVIHLNRENDPLPLHRQLYESLRSGILSGRLRTGTRLPPTRALALELGVSRNTVSKAYTQLLTEGYLESRVGSGTHVTRTLPEAMLQVGKARTSEEEISAENPPTPPRLSKRATALTELPFAREQARPQAFDSALPAVDMFPRKIWERLLINCWRDMSLNEMGYQSALGYQPLREALATYLQAARGVRCSAENIIITTGAQQAVSLATNLLLDPGDAAWVEDPSYPGIHSALVGALAEMVPISIDEEGLDVAEGIRKAPHARLAYISPSHQYPLGVKMSLTRRLQLLQWARENRMWIIEDDYDSEFRYSGAPLESVQGLDEAGRVIYIGTFSKVIYPALRIGYMVVPSRLIDPFHAARAHAVRAAPLLEQAVVAQFIKEGHFARHIRRMRTLYAERQTILVEMIQKFIKETFLKVEASEAGLHLVGWLPEGVDDQLVATKLQEHGLIAPALSSFALMPLDAGGLVLGFAAVPNNEIPMAVKRMWGVLEATIRPK
ncbi:MAG: PLP-dependent aminotransferase family protein [Candidatus Promineifilaceae bacterium]